MLETVLLEADLFKRGDSEMKSLIAIATKPLLGQETEKDILVRDSTVQMMLESDVLCLPATFAIGMISNQLLFDPLAEVQFEELLLHQDLQEFYVEMICVAV